MLSPGVPGIWPVCGRTGIGPTCRRRGPTACTGPTAGGCPTPQPRGHRLTHAQPRPRQVSSTYETRLICSGQQPLTKFTPIAYHFFTEPSLRAGAMASFRIFGPYHLDLGNQGLAPGDVQNTYWRGWSPAPTQFTVTVTAHPSTLVAGSESHANNALWVSATTVQYAFSREGDTELDDLVIYADLTNTGPAAIRYCSLYITFVEV